MVNRNALEPLCLFTFLLVLLLLLFSHTRSSIRTKYANLRLCIVIMCVCEALFFLSSHYISQKTLAHTRDTNQYLLCTCVWLILVSPESIILLGCCCDLVFCFVLLLYYQQRNVQTNSHIFYYIFTFQIGLEALIKI